MSKTLFKNLQSSYRDNIRLEVEKKRIQTDKQIATEENQMKEKTELERLETEKKIELANVDNTTRIKELELKEQQITRSQLEIERLKREISQFYSSGALSHSFIEQLPQLFESLSIDNYIVLDSGKEGGISPLSCLIQELITLAKSNGLESLFKQTPQE